ncbi:hypothetical protein FGB62_160g01 [Gracilaria domingensis]|nr:hypothetical protein FGB62_160g01 [Gracilaria domingensis]
MEEDSIVLRNLSDAVKDARCGTPNPRIAIQLCERALRFGEDPKCIEALAYNLLTITGIKTDSRRAIRLYKKAIRISDDAEAMNRLGVCYVDGTQHLESCSKRAAKWFERAIKVGNLPEAKCNLAYLLAGNDLPESYRDPVRAVSLLEDACKQVRSDVCMRTLAKIYRDVDEVYNLPRSIQLLEESLVEFKSAAARVSLLDIFLGFKRPPPDHAKALQICQQDYERTQDVASLRVMSCILWSGAINVEANPDRALELMQLHKTEKLPEEVSALRYLSKTPEEQQKLVDPLPEIGFYSTKLIHAILLSESNIESNLTKAESIFREILEESDAKVMFAWLPLSLRICRFELPFHGDRHRMTHAMMRATHCYEAGLLNLASFILEKECEESEKAEAVQLLEKPQIRA